jgi:hypothetical protein
MRILHNSRWRLALTLLCLLSFAGDNLLAQGHMHMPDGRVLSLGGFGSPQSPGGLDRNRNSQYHSPLKKQSTPSGNDDSSRCPLCQFLLLGNALLLPFVLAWLISATARTSIIPFATTTSGAISAISYSWQSRGPPLI